MKKIQHTFIYRITAGNFLSDIFEYRFNKIKADKSESSFNFNTRPELKFFKRF